MKAVLAPDGAYGQPIDMGAAGFWESILRPLPSNTAVTPTIAVMKLVTPLSLVLASFARSDVVGQMLIYLAIAPVLVALGQIVFLTAIDRAALKSEPHVEEMARITRGQITQNEPNGGNTIVAHLSERLSDNPAMASGQTAIVDQTGPGE